MPQSLNVCAGAAGGERAHLVFDLFAERTDPPFRVTAKPVAVELKVGETLVVGLPMTEVADRKKPSVKPITAAMLTLTPKHGSWLTMAEIEFSLLSRQCVRDRMADREYLTKEVSAWVRQRNLKDSEMNWRFTTEDARIKLKHLYPTILGG